MPGRSSGSRSPATWRPGCAWLGLALTLAALVPGSPAWGQSTPSDGLLQDVGFDQKLDAQVPLDLTFRDERGRPVKLADFFGEKPVILNLVYFQCPMLCNQVLNGLTRSLRAMPFDVGDQFEVVSVSIDPTETPEMATAKKGSYLRRYDRPGAEQGWHFLTGAEADIRPLADSVGFRYAYDPKSKQFAHAAGLVVLTPRGRVSRYFYGINFPVRDLEFGLMEASAERIGTPIQRLLLLCYHYDPTTGRYNFAIVTALQVLGTATALALGTFVVLMVLRERRLAGRVGAIEIEGAGAGTARSGSTDPGLGDQGET